MPEPLPASADDLDALVRTLFGECRGEPLEGQQGVAWVIRNRVEWTGGGHWWGTTVAAVCRHPFQFSCWNSNDPNYPKVTLLPVGSPEYAALAEVAQAVLKGDVDDPTGHSSHYERVGAGAAWAKNRPIAALIGAHAFYSIGPSA